MEVDGRQRVLVAPSLAPITTINDKEKPFTEATINTTPRHCICFSRSIQHEEKHVRIRLFQGRGADQSIEDVNGQTLIKDIRNLIL